MSRVPNFDRLLEWSMPDLHIFTYLISPFYPKNEEVLKAFIQYVRVLSLFLILANTNGLSAQQIYFSDNNGTLYYTDVDNGCEVVNVGLITVPGAGATIFATDMAFHPDGNLYVTNGFSLYQVDPATATATYIGDHAPFFAVFVNALVAGGDGTLYGAGGELYTIDVNTGLATSLGGLPVGSAGDLAFNDGQLYMAGVLNQLVAVNIDNPGSSTVVGTMSAGYEFFGIVTSASECTDAITYGTSDNDLYILDVSNANTTLICNLVNTIIYGAAMPTEFTAEDCDYVLDLDEDDSSGIDGSDFLAEPACDGGPFFVADVDFLVDTEDDIDSMHIYIASGDVDAPLEILNTSTPVVNLDVIGLGTDFVIAYNMGTSSIADFENFLADVLFENTAITPTPGIRAINVQYFVEGDTSNTATAFIEILNVQEPEVDLGPDQTLCEGEVVNLGATVSSDVIEYEWQDGSTGTEYLVSMPGTYILEVSNFCNATASDTVIIDYVDFIDPPNLGPDTVLCPGETLLLDAFVADGITYSWQDGSEMETFIVDGEGGVFTVEVTGECNDVVQSVTVEYEEEPIWPQLTADTVICPGDSIVLDLTTAGVTDYTWQDGTTSPEYIIVDPGTYSITMDWACGKFETSITMRFAEPETILDLGRDTFICPGTILDLNAFSPSAIDYLWQDGSTESFFEVEEPGMYEVLVSNGCVDWSDSIQVNWESCCAVYVPNAFSPNDDGINDLFKPFFECALTDYELLIFDRWGGLVYRGTDPEAGWDGRKNGERLGTGVFTWMMSYQELGQPAALEAGDVFLLR